MIVAAVALAFLVGAAVGYYTRCDEEEKNS